MALLPSSDELEQANLACTAALALLRETTAAHEAAELAAQQTRQRMARAERSYQEASQRVVDLLRPPKKRAGE